MLLVKNLSKNYKNFPVLKDINFFIKKGEIVGLVGDNGVGKTTLINCILGNIKKNTGEIILNNLPIEQNKNDSLKIVFMPDLLTVPLDFTVHDYVAYLAILKKENKNQCLQKLDKVLQELDYAKDLKNKKFNKMSAGQKKKAFCAILLSLKLDFLILDEPTANLDVNSKEEFIDILKLLNNRGVTIFITSHIIEELQQIINHLIILNNQTVVYYKIFNKNTDSIKNIYTQVIQKKAKNLNQLKNLI